MSSRSSVSEIMESVGSRCDQRSLTPSHIRHTKLPCTARTFLRFLTSSLCRWTVKRHR
jgi:hypothetical protein